MAIRKCRKATALLILSNFAIVLFSSPSLQAKAQAASASPIKVLFVGNSFTHGRYTPVRTYHAGYDQPSSTNPHVHDLLCLAASTCSPAESLPPTDPDSETYPSGVTTFAQKLTYLTSTPAAQYTETGPFGGVPGIFLQLTEDAGLPYDISIIAVSAATLDGKSFNGSKANSLLIGAAKWDRVILQDQSFEPLPMTVQVGGKAVATKGDQAAFFAGVDGLVSKIDAADAAAGKRPIPVTLYDTQPIASYGYISNNPAEPIYGSSTSPAGGVDAPYVGAAHPMQQMAADLHRAYAKAAASWNAANPAGSHLDVAPVGDAWVTALNMRIARTDPFTGTQPLGMLNLWDGDALDACCTAPIGYHPSIYGAYLDALVLFGRITGDSPLRFGPYEPAAQALGISPFAAAELQAAAAATLALNHDGF